MNKTVQFTKEWESPEGLKVSPGTVVEVTEPLHFELIERGIARDHSAPGPTETKVDGPTETQ